MKSAVAINTKSNVTNIWQARHEYYPTAIYSGRCSNSSPTRIELFFGMVGPKRFSRKNGSLVHDSTLLCTLRHTEVVVLDGKSENCFTEGSENEARRKPALLLFKPEPQAHTKPGKLGRSCFYTHGKYNWMSVVGSFTTR